MPTTTLSRQRKLVLDDAPPLVLATVAGAREKLPGHDEDDILGLIEEGKLLYAWNIARKGDTARELRIWPKCIEHYLEMSAAGKGTFAMCTLQAVIEELLARETKPWIPSTRLAILFCCGGTHIINLVDDGVLAQMPGTKYRRGPGGHAIITRKSVVEFLKERRVA